VLGAAVDDNSGDDNNGDDSTIQATQACVTGALEEVIKAGEGTSGDNGYGLLVYGTVQSVTGSTGDVLAAPGNPNNLVGQTGTPGDPIVLDPNTLTGFPNIAVQAGSVISHAFGAFQFLPGTWAQYGASLRGQPRAAVPT